MVITISIVQNVCVLELDGRFDINQVDTFDQKLKEIIEKGYYNIILDCNKMNFVSSAGLRILILNQQTLVGLNGTICLFGLNANTRRIFEITGYINLFRICANRVEALECFGITN